MKVKYFFICDSNQKSGVERKIINQVTQLKNQGMLIDLVPVDSDIVNYLPSYRSKGPFFGAFYARIKRALYIRSVFARAISVLGPEDVVYFRGHVYPLIYYPLNFLGQFRRCKLVSEHQSIEIMENKLDKNYFGFLRDIVFGAFIRRQSDAIVGVTDEITDYEVSHSGDLQKPHITIGNGFDVQSVAVRKSPQHCDDDLHLLCVSNVSRWHGLDRLLQGIATYSGTPRVVLHIAGDGLELPRLRNLATDLDINDQVVFHGFLTGKALDALFDQCHVAVGSLGIHRKGLAQTSELKAREYCARGIPYFIAVSDPDFPTDFPYILHLPDDETPINIKKILAFARTVYGDHNHPQKMRRYAEERLDWSVKMKELKDFLETLVGENGGASIPKAGVSSRAVKGLMVPGGVALPGAVQGDVNLRDSRERMF